MKALTLTLVLALTGCAGPGPVWNKAGSTQESFNADAAACEYEALKYGTNSTALPMGLLGAGIANDIHRDRELKHGCMRSKGWVASTPN